MIGLASGRLGGIWTGMVASPSSRRKADFGQRGAEHVQRGPHDIALGTAGVENEPARKPHTVVIADTLGQLGERRSFICRKTQWDRNGSLMGSHDDEDPFRRCG